MRLIADAEADGLYPSCIWVVVTKDVDTGEVHKWRRPDLDPKSFLDYTADCTQWVFHNGLGYDVPHLNRLIPGLRIDPDTVIDTQVLSRLFNYSLPGGHSLDEWGLRLGKHKIKFDKWDELTDEMVVYCERDVEITYLLFKKIEPFLNRDDWKKAIYTELQMAHICQEMHENGFSFDIDKAKSLHTDIVRQLADLNAIIQKSFPPKTQLIGEVTPRLTKHGTLNRSDFRWVKDGDLSDFTADAPFSRFEWKEFNPGSPNQIVDRLNEAGWKPYEKTKGHIEELRKGKKGDKERLRHFAQYGWKCSEGNLSTLPEDAPEGARKLRDWLLLDSRRSSLEEWIGCFNAETGAIHAKLWHIGAWTHRMSHSNPNLANISRVKIGPDKQPVYGLEGGYGAEFRSLFKAATGYKLVGVDAEGIQLRILAHLMQDQTFAEAIVTGDKANETDIHSMNRKALGANICKDRDAAKTFIYAFLLGAGIDKIAVILECSREEARIARDNFLEAYPGLKRLKEETIPLDAKRGFFRGLDGRAVQCNSEHLMLAGYLQSGEAIIMKTANLLWRKALQKERLMRWLFQVNLVHDEFQTSVLDKPSLPEYVAEVQKQSIADAGVALNLFLPLAGSSSIGLNWMQTH